MKLRGGLDNAKMYAVWKGVVPIDNSTHTFLIPRDANVMSLGLNPAAGEPPGIAFWYQCDPNNPRFETTFKVAGTGQEFDSSWRFIGTAIDRPFAWHLLMKVD